MKASGYERVDNDWYIEPAFIVDALIAAEMFMRDKPTVWDPSCGSGNIVRRMRACGLQAAGTDIVMRPGGSQSPLDFFSVAPAPSVDVIVSNPPYKHAERYAMHALMCARVKVCLLLRLAFLEGRGRANFFAATPLARVWVSRRRLSMPPGDRPDVRPVGGTVAYAWFVWEHGYSKPPQIGWV